MTDLIAYLKAAKDPPKAQAEDANNKETGLAEFLENCLFHGQMKQEDIPQIEPGEAEKHAEEEAALALVRVFDIPICPLEDQSQFKYNAVWSA